MKSEQKMEYQSKNSKLHCLGKVHQKDSLQKTSITAYTYNDVVSKTEKLLKKQKNSNLYRRITKKQLSEIAKKC